MFSDVFQLFSLIWFLMVKGGWVVLAAGLVYMFGWLYMDRIQMAWYHKLEWVFLKITVPKENDKSPLAFEQIFGHVHAMHATFTPAEKYLEGQFQIWFTWEIVSIGGTISNYVKILKKYRDTLESAIYSQFPQAEITETADYFDSLPKYNTDTSEYDIFAFNFKYKHPNPYPIRSYLEFEHSSADTFVDPVDGLWEELTKISPYEMVVFQYIFRPIADDDWKETGRKLVSKLKGEREALEEKPNYLAQAAGWLINPFIDALIIRASPGEHRPAPRKEELPPSLMLHLSEGEKEIISAIERKLAKLTYQTKLHVLYIAPREKYNPSPVYTAIIGAIKSVGSADTNSLKPDTHKWTKVHYGAFKEWEKPITTTRLNYRKRRFMSRIRRRFYFHGPAPMILSTEEIATILHFPRTEVTVPQIEKVEVMKVQPPPELPVIYDETI
jgi:hypothetical protein